MLEELHVRDLALIEETWLELGPGMTVLTGETGAGKTVLVGALKLLLGERADASYVRSGASEALVEGRFAVGGEERTARRRVGADGRSRCYLDGEMANVGTLADSLGPLVDLHGQHDHQELLRAGSHAGLFDRFAGTGPLLEEYRAAFRAHGDAVAALGSLRDLLGDRERRLEALRALLEDVGRVSPEPGEDTAVAERLPVLRHAERLAAASAAAHRALADDAGAADRLDEALAALTRVHGIDPALDALASDLAEAAERLSSTSLGRRSRPGRPRGRRGPRRGPHGTETLLGTHAGRRARCTR
jgi:DNA repair protein RecN (Recombination protein N)